MQWQGAEDCCFWAFSPQYLGWQSCPSWHIYGYFTRRGRDIYDGKSPARENLVLIVGLLFKWKAREDPPKRLHSSCPRVNAEKIAPRCRAHLDFDSLITKLFMRFLLIALWLQWLRASLHSNRISQLPLHSCRPSRPSPG
jgi:hypothetical protein